MRHGSATLPEFPWHIDVNFYFGNFFRTREPDFTEKKGLPVVYIYSVTMENTLFELLLRRSYSG